METKTDLFKCYDLHVNHLNVMLNVTNRDIVTVYLIILTVGYVWRKQVMLHQILISNQLSPWSTALEKLIVSHVVKKFPAFYGT
jgi:hypothetical protein